MTLPDEFQLVAGILVGAGTTAFGVLLTMLWERGKERKRTVEERRKAVAIVITELKENLGVAAENLTFFEKNLQLLKEGKMLNAAPVPMRDACWIVAKSSGNLFFLDPKSLGIIADTYITINFMNEQIRARENFRINNPALSRYAETLSQIDHTIAERMKNLPPMVQQTISLLEPSLSMK